MRSSCPTGIASSLFLACAAFLLQVGAAGAQQLTNNEELKAFNAVEFQFRSAVMAGQQPANDKQCELASKFYVLRVTLVENASDPKKMNKVLEDFENLLAPVQANAKINRDAVGKLAPHLVNRFKEVFALDINANRLALVNAAIMLPQLAKFRHDDIGDYLATLVGDPKLHDAIRVHAAKGLREYFPARPFLKLDLNQPNTKQMEARRDREIKRVDALLKFIVRPMPATITDPYEIEGLRYMRREAVTTLAMAGVPAVSALKGKIDGPVAVGLIKVLAKKVEPEPSVAERVEAAIGVCHFTKYVEEYDPKIGVYLVGEAISDMLGEYKKDMANIQLKGKERKPTYFAWRILAKRLEFALGDLGANTKGSKDVKLTQDAQALDALTRPMLKSIANGDPIDREVEFRAMVQKMRPNTKTLFKSDKGAPLLEEDWQTAAEEKQ